ncbi:MAG: hypothetical protein AAGA62_02585 [Bacteroidota bacterium]
MYSSPTVTTIIRPTLTLFFCFVLFHCLVAQKDKRLPSDEWDITSPYYRVMAENVVKLDTIISKADLYSVAATLERVARVEKDKALPQYYLAFVYSTIAFREEDLDKIDEWGDRSELALAKVEELGGIIDEEVLVIRALIQYARLQVDYIGRGVESSEKAEGYLLKGYKTNPDHPRILAMLSQHYLRVPAQVGGSLKKACYYADLAIAAYETEKASRPQSIFPIVPHWGELDVLEVAEKYCTKKNPPAKTKQP